MKDKFGHLKNNEDEKTKDQELRGGEPRRDDQSSDEFQEQQEEMLENVGTGSEIERSEELRRDDDIEDREIVASIKDVDWAITYELDENFDFHVKQNDKRIKVPVIWDKQERWTWARQRQNLKSVKDKVLLPLIIINRTGQSEHPSHITRPDISTLNTVGRTFSVRQRYSKKNRYDNFTVLNDAQPEKEYYRTDVPDFIQVSYDITIYTEYRWQMDDIVDLLQYYNYAYWGNEDKGKIYYTEIESISTSVEMTDEARFVQTDMSLSVDGYVIPRRGQTESTITKTSSPSKISFSEEIEQQE